MEQHSVNDPDKFTPIPGLCNTFSLPELEKIPFNHYAKIGPCTLVKDHKGKHNCKVEFVLKPNDNKV